MELAKSTDTVEQPWHDGVAPVAPSDDGGNDSSKVDQDLARAWDIKAALRWVRNDHGPLNGLRWLLSDKFGLGRPPSAVERRTAADDPTVAMHDAAPPALVLGSVTFEGGSSPRAIGSPEARAQLGPVDHS
jgi:hypothetical protein